MQRFNVVFSGQIDEKVENRKDALARSLCKLLKLPESDKERLFKGDKHILKSELSQKQAEAVKAKLMNAGIIVQVEEALPPNQEAFGAPSNDCSEDVDEENGSSRCKHCGSVLKATEEQLVPSLPVQESSEERQPQIKQSNLEWMEAHQLKLSDIFNINKLKSLGIAQVFIRIFNFWPLLIGPLYYFFKKMWMKGLYGVAMWSVYFGVLAVLEASNISVGLVWYFLPSLLFSLMVNVDIYRHKVHQEICWSFIPKQMQKLPVALFVFVVSLPIGFSEELSGIFPTTHAQGKVYEFN